MKNATDVYAMTESHLAALLANFPEHADKVRLVTCYTGNRGITDPIGCGQTAYNNVARQLTTARPSLPGWSNRSSNIFDSFPRHGLPFHTH